MADEERWTAWEPTMELRYYVLTTDCERLEQRWRRMKIVSLSSGDAIGDPQDEWRPVPYFLPARK